MWDRKKNTQEMKCFLGANQVCNEYQCADICERVLASQRLLKVTFYFYSFFSTDKTLYNPLSLSEIIIAHSSKYGIGEV